MNSHSGHALSNVDPAERRIMFDASWPLLLLIMTAAYVLTWSLGLLAIDLSTILWVTFGLALGHQILSRLLDGAQTGLTLVSLHAVLNVVAVSGLGLVWALLGGLAAPAFAIFLALPLIALGLVSRFGLQIVLSAYAIFVAWMVALYGSASLRLQLEQLGVPPVWKILPVVADQSFVGYGVVASGGAQLQFMVVLSFAMVGVVSMSAIVVALISRLYKRLKYVSASEQRAERLAQSFLTQEDGLEFILDRESFQVIAVSPKLAETLKSVPETLVGCHYSAVLPFDEGHPVNRLIEMGFAAELSNQVFPTVSGYQLVKFRLHPRTSEQFEFQRISIEMLQDCDFALMAVTARHEICGVVDGGGRILYLSKGARDLLPIIKDEWSADFLPLPAGWWEIAPRASHRRQVSIAKIEYNMQLHRSEYQLRLCRGALNRDSDSMEVTVFQMEQIAGGPG